MIPLIVWAVAGPVITALAGTLVHIIVKDRAVDAAWCAGFFAAQDVNLAQIRQLAEAVAIAERVAYGVEL